MNKQQKNRQREWLRKISAALLLLLFVFSITPRKDLHDFLADHRDTPVKPVIPGTAGLSIAGFHCDCDSLVVESPFLASLLSNEWHPISFWACSPVPPLTKWYTAIVLSASLRGPPFA